MRRLLLAALLALPLCAHASSVRIGVVPVKGGEYADALLAGAQRAAKDFTTVDAAVTVDSYVPATPDTAGQAAALLKAASSGCTGLLLNPAAGAKSPAFLSKIEDAYRSGCQGIVVDVPFSSPYVASLVGTGFYQAGQEAGAYLAKRIGGDGGVLIVGDSKAALSIAQYEKGIIEGLRLYPNAQAIGSGDLAQMIAAYAPSEVPGLLKRLGSRVAAVCVADPEALPDVLAALKDPAVTAKPVVMVFGNRKAALAALRAGEIDSVIADCPYLVGYYGLKAAVAAARGKPVPAQRNVATRILTADKLDDPKIAAFLDPAASNAPIEDEKPSRPSLIENP
ncbi:MAG TPA: substrate-binding domain-containing protein [Candidatus Methylacidiphilales bacterium]